MARSTPPESEPQEGPATELFERICQVARQIPAGQVASYGQVALVAGANSARLVGNAMARLPAGSDVPWHRVINSQGKISARREGKPDPRQRRRLKEEGVLLDRKGQIDFAAVAWPGPSWQWLDAEGYDIDLLVLKSRSKPRRGMWVNWQL